MKIRPREEGDGDSGRARGGMRGRWNWGWGHWWLVPSPLLQFAILQEMSQIKKIKALYDINLRVFNTIEALTFPFDLPISDLYLV